MVIELLKATEPLVSIVIPVYNGSNYMREAIDSALAQTYKNIEVLVINDGSSDDGATESIALSCGDKIRYFRKENGGVASALNLGIREMRGEYFVWLSHDDVFPEGRIDCHVRMFGENPERKILYSKVTHIDSIGKPLASVVSALEKITGLQELFINGNVDFCSMTIHRTCFEKVGMFDESNRTMQDVEMSIRLARHFTFYYSPDIGVFRRRHDERGTVTLKNIHDSDMLKLGRKLYSEYPVEVFFPSFGNMSPKEKSVSLEWLGDRLRNFYAFKESNIYYRMSFELKWCFSVQFKIILGADNYHKLLLFIKRLL